MKGRRTRWVLVAAATAACLLCSAFASAAQAATFTASSISSPAAGAELFYDADSGSGSIPVTGTVTPAITNATGGDLLCYSAPGSKPFTVQTGIAVSAGTFTAEASLAPIASTACRLRFVPHGTIPTTTAATPFDGPQVSVSEQATHSADGNVFGYYILSGTLPWSFSFGSLGECPVLASYATDTDTLGSYLLFAGNACLLQASGIPPDQGTRSAVQVDGLNAYPPAAVSTLAGVPGFTPLSYTAEFDPDHDTVTINESENLEDCTSPGSYPPSSTSCPSVTPSGISVTQSTTLLPGAQVARVSQTFTSLDGNPHSLDLLFSQSVSAPSATSTPAFEFPGQPVFASHAVPDSFSLFPAGPGSIYVISNAADQPATSNPIGAITYNQPPTGADFVNASSAQTGTFLMHYAETIPAGGTFTMSWSFSQANSTAQLIPLVQTELDTYYTPTLTVSAPGNVTSRTSPITVRGVASDAIQVSSVTVDGVNAPLAASGGFSAAVKLHDGSNRVTVTATNIAGNRATVARTVRYAPVPCTVPNLLGRTLTVARRLLTTHDCTPGKVARRTSSKIASGRIISISPKSGSRWPNLHKVALVVSLGRPKKKPKKHVVTPK
jgi:Glucodextranase, domain B/PASTA domain